jgi:hypothetical protein
MSKNLIPISPIESPRILFLRLLAIFLVGAD